MYISDTYHLFYLSTTKPSGPDHLLHLVLANLSIIQESFFFFFFWRSLPVFAGMVVGMRDWDSGPTTGMKAQHVT